MGASKTYTNPVFNSSFPDPFVLKYRGQYFGYCTGFSSDGRVFSILQSNDLVNWTSLSGAMGPLPTGEPYYWAPEVTYYNGKFYLYYSVGNETLMAIRVAVSDRPDGGFVDAGKVLTPQTFAIDAHVFRDDDSRWYMFYATDFLEHSHVGTGTVVDRMLDPFTLEGNPRPVTRAKYDWQVYDPQRIEKGGVRWHTVEGPFLLKRKGIYYEMFSGGNWQNISYGVSFAAIDDIEFKDEWYQYSDGEKAFPILRTIPDRVVGPGHNSVVVGPNNRELYCVYHRWVSNERVLAIDRMDFSGGNRLFIIGPTDTSQPAPFQPSICDYFNEVSDEWWKIRSGSWKASESELIPTATGNNEILSTVAGESFRCEVWIRFEQSPGTAGFCLYAEEELYAIQLNPQTRQISFTFPSGEEIGEALPTEFDFSALHHVRLDIDYRTAMIYLDRIESGGPYALPSGISKIGLFSRGPGCAFSAFSFTGGFEELFDRENLHDRGWEIHDGDGSSAVENQLLRVHNDGRVVSALSKNVPSGDYEFVINLSREQRENDSGIISFACGTVFELVNIDDWKLRTREEVFDLPSNFLSNEYHQFRFISIGGKIEIFLDESFLGSTNNSGEISDQIEIGVQNATALFEMIRYTVI